MSEFETVNEKSTKRSALLKPEVEVQIGNNPLLWHPLKLLFDVVYSSRQMLLRFSLTHE